MYICDTLEVTGLTHWLFKNHMEKNKARGSSLKPHEDAEFPHACMVRGVQTTARARLSRLMTLGSLPSLSYKASTASCSGWKSGREGWKTPGKKKRGKTLLATSSSHPFFEEWGGLSCLVGKLETSCQVTVCCWAMETHAMNSQVHQPSYTKQTLLLTLLSWPKKEHL